MSGLAHRESAQIARDRWLVCAALAVVSAVAFWPLWRNDFIHFDDPFYITHNPVVRQGLTAAGIRWAFTRTHAGNWHPVTWLSHMLDVELFGVNPRGHHLMNLALHIAGAWALFLVLCRMTAPSTGSAGGGSGGPPRPGPEAPGRTGAFWASAAVAALFAVHPLHVESVAWASERKDVLGALFGFLAIGAYVQWTEKPTAARYAAIVAWFGLSLMSKQTLVTLPFVLLLLDYWPLGRWPARLYGVEAGQRPAGLPRFAPVGVGRLIAEKLPLGALTVAASLVVLHVQSRPEYGLVKSLQSHPIEARVGNALNSYVKYLEQTMWPFNLAVFYPHPRTGLPWWYVAVAAGVLAAVTAVAVRMGRRFPYAPVGWFWYLGTLVPMVGLVQVGLQARADRYTYVALVGVFVVVAWGIRDLTAGWQYRREIVGVLGGAVLVGLVVRTMQQTTYWRNSGTLYRHAIAVTTNNYWAHNNLGIYLATQGELDEALAHFSRSRDLEPNAPGVYVNMAVVLVRTGRYSEAIERLQRALTIDPHYVDARYQLGMAYAKLGRPQEAIRHLTRTLDIDPRHANARFALAKVLLQLGDTAGAMRHLSAGLQVRPNDADGQLQLGRLLVQQGRIDEAIGHFRAALAQQPGFAEAHNSLGIALQARGETRSAIQHYQAALRIRPEMWAAALNLARIFASHPDPQFRNAGEAIRLAEEAYRRTNGSSAAVLDVLGTAYAEAGQFGTALAMAREARKRAASANQTELAKEIGERMLLYEDRKPYRMPKTSAGTTLPAVRRAEPQRAIELNR